MALVKYGGTVSAMSGKVDATVHSHNRYGRYVRGWVKPTLVTSQAAVNAKAYFGNASQHFQSLSNEDQNSWKTWAQQHPQVNRMGDQIILDGHAACTQLNARLGRMGVTHIDVPPTDAVPLALSALGGTFDIGAGSFDLTFAVTPVPADTQYWVKYAVVMSAGVKYVRNLLVLISELDAAAASPQDTQAAIEARLGTLQVGNIVHMEAYAVDKTNGQRSSSIFAQVTVSST